MVVTAASDSPRKHTSASSDIAAAASPQEKKKPPAHNESFFFSAFHLLDKFCGVTGTSALSPVGRPLPLHMMTAGCH